MVSEPSKLTLGEWVEIWLNTYKKNAIKPTTYDMYYHLIHSHIIPSLGTHKLDRLTPIIVQRFINDIYLKKDLSQSTLKKIVTTLSQAYEKAIDLNMIFKNPCAKIDIPAKPKRKVVAFTKEEQENFVAHCTGKTSYDHLFIFALDTGLRMGELLALSPEDYDKKNETIFVNKNLSVINDYSEDSERKRMTIIDTTKTESGERSVPLTKAARAVLEKQLEISQGSPFVFASTAGTPLEKRNIYRELNKRLNQANISSPVTFHSLRHSFATRLLEKGADIKTVSELMGHKSIQITLDIYSHVGEDLKKNTISLLD